MKRSIVLGVCVALCLAAPTALFAAPDIGIGQLGSTGLSSDTPQQVISSVTSFVAGLIAVLSVLMIIVGGVMYITSAGDSGKADKAKGIIVSAIIGLVVAILAYAIVIYVGRAMGLAW